MPAHDPAYGTWSSGDYSLDLTALKARLNMGLAHQNVILTSTVCGIGIGAQAWILIVEETSFLGSVYARSGGERRDYYHGSFQKVIIHVHASFADSQTEHEMIFERLEQILRKESLPKPRIEWHPSKTRLPEAA